MAIEQIDPDVAHQRQQDGWRYVDVRTPAEFAAGHPTGAVNIPFLMLGPMGMTPNPNFLTVMQRHFSTDTPLLMGCKSGGRSQHAAEILQANGYGQLVNVAGGFLGAPGVPGWSDRDLPKGTDGAAYDTLI